MSAASYELNPGPLKLGNIPESRKPNMEIQKEAPDIHWPLH